jgi:hypothetical protein
VADRVLGHYARPHELLEILFAAGLYAGAGEAITAEGLCADTRAGNPAIQVEVTDPIT